MLTKAKLLHVSPHIAATSNIKARARALEGKKVRTIDSWQQSKCNTAYSSPVIVASDRSVSIMQLITVLSFVLAIFSTTLQAKKYTKASDAVLLSNVRSLTLQKDRLTTGRRSKPVQQMACVGGSGKGLHDVDVMRCKNSGAEYDPEDVQWTCQANLPPEFKLGSTEVVCEGYDSPDDPYVLKGSCGVEYRLVLTEQGEEKFSKQGFFGNAKSEGGINKVWTFLFWAIFISEPVSQPIVFRLLTLVIEVVILVIVSGALTTGGNALGNVGRGFGGGGGGPGGGGWGGSDDDPPPPYTPRSSYGSTRSSYKSSSRNPNSGPGFWSGAGLGGAAGYAAGNYMGRQSERARQQPAYGVAGPSNYGGGSSWFGGGGGGSGAGPSAPSPARYESTGFGGTRRR